MSEVRDYISLLKPRVMSLVVFTGFVGMFLAPGQINPLIAIVAIFCISIGSGAAGAINMWVERDSDKKMKRTKNRALPAGRLDPTSSLEFAIFMAIFSVFLMAFAVNYLAAFWLIIAILFYVFVYTIWLKPRTPQNIVIGGAAGAFPPVIGWACVTPDLSLFPWLLFLIIFLWTPPHFWALALYRNEDYKNANIPMLPVVKGIKRTTIEMLIYTIVLAVTCISPYWFGFTGKIYLISAIILNLIFIYHSIKTLKNPSEKNSMKMFGFSILYLFILFTSLIIDSKITF